MMPGTVGNLPASINMFSNLESFPVLSYLMKSQNGTKTHTRLYPPADPAKRYGLATLGLVNSLAGDPTSCRGSREPRQVYQVALQIYRVLHLVRNMDYHKPIPIRTEFHHKKCITFQLLNT